MPAIRLLCLLILAAISPPPPLVHAERTGGRSRGNGNPLNPATAAAARVELFDMGGSSDDELSGIELKESHGADDEGEVDEERGHIVGVHVVGVLHGVYAGAVPMYNISGEVFQLPDSGYGGEEGGSYPTERSPSDKDWVGVLFCSEPKGSDESIGTARATESLLLDRMKEAMLLGASAFILLAMNRNVLKEFYLSQLMAKVPVVIVEDIQNITNMLSALASKLKLRATLTFYPPKTNLQTYTLWSACWRAHPGSGVICMSDSDLSKSSWSQLYGYFYSALAVIMLLLLIKAEPGRNYDDLDEPETLESVVRQALAAMKTRRYRRRAKLVCNHDDSERDTCAICLENFYWRQKIRVLPCVHEFHCKCIDPWLEQHPTCPLCKCNIIE